MNIFIARRKLYKIVKTCASFKCTWILLMAFTGLYLLTKAILNLGFDESEQGKWGQYYRGLIVDYNIKPYKYKFDKECNKYFLPTIEDNMRLVSNYSVIRNMQKQYPDMHKTFGNPVMPGKEEYPVLVTAASSNHFSESVKMIKSAQKNLFPHYKGMEIIFYDIGLRPNQRKMLKSLCNCEIRTFNFKRFPGFVTNLRNYVWKPLIIYEMLLEYNFVMWADSSVVFHGSKYATNISFQRAKDVGVLVQQLGCECRSFMHTKHQTFQILQEPVCKFEFYQLEATFIMVWKTDFTWKYVIKPWLACALTENCMSHPNPNAVIYCRGKQRLHQCHRFDQSVLSIILQRIFNEYYNVITLNRLPKIYEVIRT